MPKRTRESLLKPVKRVVVKIGSGVLTAGDSLNMEIIGSLTEDICELKEKDIEVILVSSGAIAAGLKKLGLKARPQSISQQQAVAAVGQSTLVMAYEEMFRSYGHKVAQVLLTRDDLTHRRRYLNARNTVFTLLSWKVLPIINENDTVVVDEIKFGDNDNLSAMVANMTTSSLLVNLTNIDGLFDSDPRHHKEARMIRVVENVDRQISKYANAIPGFLGRGGMASKVKAARNASLGGIPTIIANGLKPHILIDIFNGREEGTLFLPKEEHLSSKKHWIAFTKAPRGEIVVDRGAEEALVNGGKSLLPRGIKEVRGRFSLGDSVSLISESGEQVGVGMVNYHSGEIKKIIGHKSSDIESIIGHKHDDEVVHRDNLVLTSQSEEGRAYVT